jgi:DNA-directed RNA polymerase specialized sigma24 family protein
MTSEGSVTGWLGQLRTGDAAAAQQLWQRYFQRLVQLARHRIRGGGARGADEEDIALSAFASFCGHVERGRWPQLQDRDDLWRLLVVLTARKASHLLRDERRLKRGGAGTPTASGAGDGVAVDLDQLVSREPSPAFAAQVADECRRLLQSLGDPALESVALRKMEGYTVEEIGEQLGYAPRSVKRKLRLIRDRWEKEMASE